MRYFGSGCSHSSCPENKPTAVLLKSRKRRPSLTIRPRGLLKPSRNERDLLPRTRPVWLPGRTRPPAPRGSRRGEAPAPPSGGGRNHTPAPARQPRPCACPRELRPAHPRREADAIYLQTPVCFTFVHSGEKKKYKPPHLLQHRPYRALREHAFHRNTY